MASWWRRIKISAVFHVSSRRDSLSHAATRVISRKTNRRHMIGDHHGRATGKQLCWSEPWTGFSARTTTSAHAGSAEPVTPARRGKIGRPPAPAYPGLPANLRQLAIASADQVRPVTWRQATKGNPVASMTSHFLVIRVRPANRDIPRAGDGSLPDCWLLAEWPPPADEPTDYWLSTLPPTPPSPISSASPRSD